MNRRDFASALCLRLRRLVLPDAEVEDDGDVDQLEVRIVLRVQRGDAQRRGVEAKLELAPSA